MGLKRKIRQDCQAAKGEINSHDYANLVKTRFFCT